MNGLKVKKVFSSEYLYNEYKNFRDNLIIQNLCTVGLINKNIFRWRITLMGPADTPYSDGKFILKVNFENDYPNSKPEIRFVNKIYHLNVSPKDGHIYHSILYNWVPKTPMIDIISDIYSLFYNQEPNNSHDLIMAKEYETDRNEFNRKAQEWTKKYAS